MADPFVSGAPEAEKDPPDGRTRKGLPAYRAAHLFRGGLFISRGNECDATRRFTCLHRSPPVSSIRLLPVEIKKKEKKKENTPPLVIRKIVPDNFQSRSALGWILVVRDRE